MTLTEYLAQPEPVRMPEVILEPSEYKIWITVPMPDGSTLSSVRINAFPQYEYVLKSNGKCLWTADEHGNPKKPSCFYIQ